MHHEKDFASFKLLVSTFRQTFFTFVYQQAMRKQFQKAEHFLDLKIVIMLKHSVICCSFLGHLFYA